MHTLHYRRWCPPQSPIGIEFPPELLHEVRLEGAQAATAARLNRTRPRDRSEDHSTGILFGSGQDGEVRILTARSSAHPQDPRLAGMRSVGIFVCRARGEVFLTDTDLVLFESVEGSVALVIAGGQAGFFVRELDGTVQSIRSHEEFAVADVAAAPVPIPVPALPAPPPKRVLKRAVTSTGLLCVPLAALMYLEPALPQPPLAVAVREDAGQLMVNWQSTSQPELGRLEIVDGSERTVVPLAPAQNSITYAHHTGDVEVRLVTGTRQGSARWQAPHFVAHVPTDVRDPDAVREEVTRLEREATILRAAVENRKTRTAELTRRIVQLSR